MRGMRFLIVHTISFGLMGCSNSTPQVSMEKQDRTVQQNDVVQNSGTQSCHESTKYLVVERENEEMVGADILVKYKSDGKNISCVYQSEQGDLEIKNTMGNAFGSIKKDFLIVHSSTGPDVTHFMVWDLSKRAQVFEGEWSSNEKSDDSSLVYWRPSDEEPTEKLCPELQIWKENSLGAGIDVKVRLDLSTLQTTELGDKQCSARQ